MEYKTEFGIRFDKLQASPEMEIYRNLQALVQVIGFLIKITMSLYTIWLISTIQENLCLCTVLNKERTLRV